MADPVSISANFAALFHFSTTVIKYLSEVRDAPDHLKRLRAEVISTVGLLSILKVLIETEEVSLPTLQSLTVPNGPLEQFQSLLERLAKALPLAIGLKKALAWPFQKSEVTKLLSAIERQKVFFSLA